MVAVVLALRLAVSDPLGDLSENFTVNMPCPVPVATKASRDKEIAKPE